MPEVTLITGGGRSGKSSEALTIAAPYARKAFIATAMPFDDEMQKRIDNHKRERDGSFTTIEEPLDLAGALGSLSGRFDAAIIDCLPVWLGNCLHLCPNELPARIDALTAAIESAPCDLIIVTNEVGMGIIPDNELSRHYRDMLGSLNQRIASLASRVILMVCGIPVSVK